MAYIDKLRESAAAIKSRLGGFEPEVLMILGSGLGGLGDRCENPIYIPYAEIPYFVHSTAPGHAGRLVCGMLGGQCVMVMQGRVHTYEGYTPQEVAYPVQAARLLGVSKLLVTNAAGAVNTAYMPGEFLLITDHIRLFDSSPLCGENLDELGTRFPDMSECYTRRLRDVARKAAKSLKIKLHEGVYMFFPGPQYETPAEVRAARILGADVVGMSTVPEVTVAGQCGMETLGITFISNMGSGYEDRKFTETEVFEAADAARPQFEALVIKCLEGM